MVRTHDARPRRLAIPKLKEELDRVFSQYIRLRDANDNGFCKCVTCGTMWVWRVIHNGHYIPRQHMATRYDERNCHPCCYHCNVILRGNLKKYRQFIISKYGKGILEELEAKKFSIEKWTASDYTEKISYYKEKVKQLIIEKGL